MSGEKEVTTEQFDAALLEIVRGMTPEAIFALPGVYEAVSEALNNEAIERARENAEADEETCSAGGAHNYSPGVEYADENACIKCGNAAPCPEGGEHE
jgi:hypothetical protein